MLLLKYADEVTPTYSPSIIDAAFSSARDFYRAASYGQFALNWDIFGPFSLPMNHPCDPTIAYKDVPSAARSAAVSAGVNLDPYPTIVLAGTGCPESPLPWDAADIGGPYIYLYGTGAVTGQVVAHELGHNLGLRHANYLDCQAVPYISGGDSCTTVEYGDPIETMGIRYHDFNAVHKDELGWIQPLVVTQAGTYDIGPIDSPGPLPKALKLVAPSAAEPTYIEYRQPIGLDIPDTEIWFDELYQGATIHVGTDPTELLNVYPGTNVLGVPGLMGGPSLLPGMTYVDPDNRFVITTLSVSPESMKVRVAFPSSEGGPVVSFGQPLDGQTVSASVPIAITASDPSGIDKVELYIDGSLVEGQQTPSNSAYLFNWNSAGISGAHRLTATAYARTGAQSSQAVNVTVHPLPVVRLATSTSSLVPGGEVVLLAQAATGSADALATVTFTVTTQSGIVTNIAGTSSAAGIYKANWTPRDIGRFTVIAVAQDTDGYSGFSNAVVLSSASIAITSGAVVNAASFVPGVTPGALVSIFGGGFSPNSLGSGSGVPLPVTLGGVSVTFNEIPGALLYISPNQINVQVPWEVQGQGPGIPLVHVVVNGANGAAEADVPFLETAPAIFRIPNGGWAVAFNSDGSLVAPSGSVPGFQAHPARAGDVIGILGTGFGAVTPPATIGENSADVTRTANVEPTVTIGGIAAPVLFAGLSPEFPGVNQLNVLVPDGVFGDSVQVIVKGPLNSDGGSKISVAQ